MDRVTSPTNGAPASRSKLRLGVIAAGLCAVALVLGPAIPHEQHIALELGALRYGVTDVTVRLGRGGEWERGVTWRYDRDAPRHVEWRFEGANGAADLEIEVRTPERAHTQRRAVRLDGAKIDVQLAEVTGQRDTP